MKKLLKNNYKLFIGIILGALISGYSTYATTINSQDIAYDNSNSGLNATDAKEAVDELYGIYNSGNAEEGDILTGKSAFVKGSVKNGTMPNHGAVSQSLNTSTTSYTIPAGYHNGSGTVSISTQTKSATPSTSAQTISPDSGKLLSSVSVGAISTQEKTVTSSRSAQTVTPDSGKYLSKVTVNALAPTGTFTPTSRAANIDMGATSNYRYVTTTSVPNSNSGTYKPTAVGSSVDMGETNSYRYIDTLSFLQSQKYQVYAIYNISDKTLSSGTKITAFGSNSNLLTNNNGVYTLKGSAKSLYAYSAQIYNGGSGYLRMYYSSDGTNYKNYFGCSKHCSSTSCNTSYDYMRNTKSFYVAASGSISNYFGYIFIYG